MVFPLVLTALISFLVSIGCDALLKRNQRLLAHGMTLVVGIALAATIATADVNPLGTGQAIILALVSMITFSIPQATARRSNRSRRLGD